MLNREVLKVSRLKKILNLLQNERHMSSLRLFDVVCCRLSHSQLQLRGISYVAPLAWSMWVLCTCSLPWDCRQADLITCSHLRLVMSFTPPCSLAICYCLTEVSSGKQLSSLVSSSSGFLVGWYSEHTFS